MTLVNLQTVSVHINSKFHFLLTDTVQLQAFTKGNKITPSGLQDFHKMIVIWLNRSIIMEDIVSASPEECLFVS